jgi:DNA-binding Xre family transcriptional regulator
MDKAQLFEIVDKMQDCGMDVLNALCMSLDVDTLEDHLRYIDRNYETNCFED